MNLLFSLAFLLLSYLVGSFSFAAIFKNQSLHSKQVNLLKIQEIYRLKWEILFFALDLLKAYLFLNAIRSYRGDELSIEWFNAYALFISIAHFYPIFTALKAVKQPSVIIAVLWCFDPSIAILALGIYLFSLFMFHQIAYACVVMGMIMLFMSQQTIIPLFFLLNITLFILIMVRFHREISPIYLKFFRSQKKATQRKR